MNLKAPPWSARFWSKVNKTNCCWVWTAAKNKKGYGVFGIQRKTYKAHRVSWLLKHGAMPRQCLLHSCDNPSCVNPDHLTEGTRAENNADMVRKGRHVPGGTYIDPLGAGYTRGVNHHTTKLTVRQVKEIRSSDTQGQSMQSIADAHGAGLTTVWKIINRKTWRHV